jgi:hypothetical protein
VGKGCLNKHIYHPSQSSTAKKQEGFTRSYLGGNITGDLYTDDVYLGKFKVSAYWLCALTGPLRSPVNRLLVRHWAQSRECSPITTPLISGRSRTAFWAWHLGESLGSTQRLSSRRSSMRASFWNRFLGCLWLSQILWSSSEGGMKVGLKAT